MRLSTEHLLESRDIPGPGHAAFRLDADEAAQALVAAQLGEHGLGGDVAEGDPQDDCAPEDVHGVVIAALAAGPAQRVEQLGVGQGGEQILDGLQRGAVFERLPIEQGLGGVEDHHGRGHRMVDDGYRATLSLATQLIPATLAARSKNRGEWGFAGQSPEEFEGPWGNAPSTPRGAPIP